MRLNEISARIRLVRKGLSLKKKKELGVEVAKESFCDFYESKLLTKLIYNKLREQDNG